VAAVSSRTALPTQTLRLDQLSHERATPLTNPRHFEGCPLIPSGHFDISQVAWTHITVLEPAPEVLPTLTLFSPDDHEWFSQLEILLKSYESSAVCP